MRISAMWCYAPKRKVKSLVVHNIHHSFMSARQNPLISYFPLPQWLFYPKIIVVYRMKIVWVCVCVLVVPNGNAVHADSGAKELGWKEGDDALRTHAMSFHGCLADIDDCWDDHKCVARPITSNNLFCRHVMINECAKFIHTESRCGWF